MILLRRNGATLASSYGIRSQTAILDVYISCNMTCIYICIITDHTKRMAKRSDAANKNGVFAKNLITQQADNQFLANAY